MYTLCTLYTLNIWYKNVHFVCFWFVCFLNSFLNHHVISMMARFSLPGVLVLALVCFLCPVLVLCLSVP